MYTSREWDNLNQKGVEKGWGKTGSVWVVGGHVPASPSPRPLTKDLPLPCTLARPSPVMSLYVTCYTLMSDPYFLFPQWD